MATSPSKEAAVRLIGYEPAGLSKSAAQSVVDWVVKLYAAQGKDVRLESIQFLPSSVTQLTDKEFQLVANTVIDIANGEAPRSQMVDSVVTVQKHQQGATTKNVFIPSLEKAAS